MWFVQNYTTCQPVDLLDFLELRINTFVVEQQRIYHELDAYDRQAWHIFYRDSESNKLTAYARLFKKAGELTFGRVVIAPEARGSGFGKQLTAKILETAQAKWPNEPIVIEAQAYIVPLYAAFGFETRGEPFIFEGSPHVTMHYQTKKA